MAVALDVQHQAWGRQHAPGARGGARDGRRGAGPAPRALRVQTAQARLSARVVTVIPFALVAVFSLVSKGFLIRFCKARWGWPVGLGIAMEVAGCSRCNTLC